MDGGVVCMMYVILFDVRDYIHEKEITEKRRWDFKM